MDSVTLIECPRDAWQGLAQVIPVETKVAYLRKLIDAGFRHIDAVSFVSPKHVKQMADSEAVMEGLSDAGVLEGNEVEIIGIVVNERGLERALATPGVTTVGYPYSISAYFRRANANMSRAESRALVEKLRRETTATGRNLVVYISMAFGNPYDEPWGPEIVEETLQWLDTLGVETVSLADTVGTAKPAEVGALFSAMREVAPDVELGVHLHSRPEGIAEKVLAAYEGGCRRFDSALTGLGGCPFASDELVGNISTEVVIPTLLKQGADLGIDTARLSEVVAMSREIAAKYTSPLLVN